jgi:hypothetical protein
VSGPLTAASSIIQRKRLPSGSSFKAALRDPTIEIDVSGKAITDEGFLEVVNALVDCHATVDNVMRLEELSLRGCNITAASLLQLANVVSLARYDLRDLDLSFNDIQIKTERDIYAWQRFLDAFKDCYVLSRVDFSGNQLDQKAFEVFAKVYLQSDALDFLEPVKPDLIQDIKVLSPKSLNTKLGCLSLGGNGSSLRGKGMETPTKTKISRLGK